MSYRFDTLAIHAGQANDPSTGAVTVPIYQTSTFEQIEPGVSRGFDYSRTNHPTRKALEDNLAALEGARFGLAFSSGMAAIHNVLSTLRAGDHVVTTQDLYGGAWRIFVKYFSKFGIDFTFVDTTDLPSIEKAIRPATRLLWLETPSNPLLKLTNIAASASIARRHGIRTVVDNTFATPVLQQPLALGADVVVHSTTKYINGHSDCLGGCVITNDELFYNELKFFQNAIGAVPAPQDCFLILRGIKTLSLRVERQCANARQIVEFLREQERVRRIYYPGFGAIVSFDIDGDAVDFARSLELWTLAESLGSVKSLFCHPATMTHASMDAEVRKKVGIGDGLIRLSVGLEDVRDLIEDLEQALVGRVACAR
ncbi:MAG TPA: PLP-dependent aspartate aminotransferase family protein [Thermoanaerobaculia bacterium]|nr:PLP-dependent aspartate aminotransferase family protein [Thermoanaerobaculia bacterium]